MDPTFIKPQVQSNLVLHESIGLLINDIHDSNPTVKSEGLQLIFKAEQLCIDHE